MRRLHPRSPYEKLGGYVHLPRLIDKARLHRKGLLDGYNYKTVGFDKHLLSFLKIDGDAFEDAVHRLDKDDAVLKWVEENAIKHSPEEVEHWNEAMISRHPDTAAKKARLLRDRLWQTARRAAVGSCNQKRSARFDRPRTSKIE